MTDIVQRINAHATDRAAARQEAHASCADDPFVCWSCDEFTCGDIDENNRWVRDDCACPCHDTRLLLSEASGEILRLLGENAVLKAELDRITPVLNYLLDGN